MKIYLITRIFWRKLIYMRAMRLVNLFVMLFLVTACAQTVNLAEIKPNHHTNEGFRNIPYVETASSKGAMFVLRRIWGSAFHPSVPLDHQVPENLAISELEKLSGNNTITWLGHSTFLLRIGGKNILTDPFLTNRASPFSFAGGVTRYVPPGITINNLPDIDMIIVSHNHYDHLDRYTVCALPNKEDISVFIPLGLKPIFSGCGYKKIHELDWWMEAHMDELNIVALPAVHDSGRGLTDKDETLWSSWAIIIGDKKYYFGGDTGYSPVFRDIGGIYGAFDLAIVPIGAYEPRKLMWMSHVTPEEAVQIGIDINAKTLVGGHWGTIELSDEDHWEPPTRFESAGKSAGMDANSIWVMKVGETKILP